MNDLLLAVVPTVIGSAVTWFFARKKNDAEAESVELENVQKAIAIWRESATELSKKCAELTEEIGKLREENISLKIEIKALQTQMHEVQIKTN
jgi:predicted  nucleic acid-binding Zn-ribbon protein